MQGITPPIATYTKDIAKKLLTLAIVNQRGQVLLGLKKRGFGEGYYNGFGGKVEVGETIEGAARRELQEEAGIVAGSILKQGVLTFHFDDKPQPWEVHVFNILDYSGEPCETDEMSPQWFSHGEIPFDKMWKDDEIWYPHFLAGDLFKGEFYFCNTHHLDSYNFGIVPEL
ncbi:hypothetical protein GOP47_0022207 [Adiantum capillus-veneris]|uniref:Oxidized purine nucleoside triphosphate hydrolase n=1 Tax=Adiantum capillus-veneris TaxID=13818 RepID=A0A9D4U9I5_ADICA|nr:hypothetical protein GOP47_0022207 [Adiantum capillus-veneris]